MDREALKAFTHDLAVAAGELIRPYFQRADLDVDTKDDATPVTVADREAEKLLRELIAKQYPDHGLWGEEYGKERADAEYVWVLDPIDGTKSFAAGSPLFGTLIALLHRGQPIVGAIANPVLGEIIIGDNEETRLNGEVVRVNDSKPLDKAILSTTDWRRAAKHRSAEGWAALEEAVLDARTWGDCYGYLMLASGRVDIMCDPMMAPWDLLALIPVVRGAGGVVTDWHGEDPVTGNSLVAAPPSLHPQVLKLLNP